MTGFIICVTKINPCLHPDRDGNISKDEVKAQFFELLRATISSLRGLISFYFFGIGIVLKASKG